MDKVCYTSVTTCAGHANSFTRGIFIWVIQRIGQEWQPLILLCISLPPDLKSKRIYRYESRPYSDCGGISPFQSDHLQPRPKTALYVLSKRDLGSEYSAHDCGVLGTTWLLFAPISSVIVIVETLHLLTIGNVDPFVPSTQSLSGFRTHYCASSRTAAVVTAIQHARERNKVFPSLTNSRHRFPDWSSDKFLPSLRASLFPIRNRLFSRLALYL